MGAARRAITLCFFLLTTMVVSAQSTIIKGELLDSLTREGEPYATVRVYKQSNEKQAVAMSVTDLDGRFSQPVKGKGAFVVIFSSVGKGTLRRNVTLGGEAEINLGTLLMRDDTEMLKGVEVVAQAPLVKMETDKMSYNVSDDVDSKSSTVLDMLRKVPMVSVDGQDNITVNGSSSFKVYVDGKPNPMLSSNPSQIFKAMPASMVKSIEVVTNPGAKYDAEGAAGVLNIITQRAADGSSQANMNGYNGSVQLQAANRGFGGGGSVNVQQGKLSIGTNLFFRYQNLKGTEVEMDRVQHATPSDIHTVMTTDGRVKSQFNMGSLSFNYDIDSLSTIGGSASIMFGNNNNRLNGRNTMSGGFYGEGFGYGTSNNSKNRFESINASLDYQRFFNADRTRSITLSYLFNISPNRSKTENHYELGNGAWVKGDEDMPDLSSFLSDNNTTTQEHTFQVDYTTPIGKGQTLSTGGKFIGRINSSNSKYYIAGTDDWQLVDDRAMKYRHLNDIAAGYAEYAGTFGKVGTKAGLRYEHTWQRVKYLVGEGNDFHTDYGNLVPSASISYNFAPTQNIGLTYNMRISRPSISYLNPYHDKTDPTAISYGNSDLDVEKSHNIGLVINSFTPKLMVNLNLRQSFSNNGIAQYSFYENNILHSTYGNVVHSSITSANLYMNWALAKATRVIFNGGVGYNDLHSQQLGASSHGWTGNAMLGLQQTLPWQLKLSMNLMANTKSYELQGWRSGFSGCFGSLTKQLLDEKLNVSVFGFTGLRSGGKLVFDNYSHSPEFTNQQKIKVPVALCGIQLTYNFGNMKKQMRQHQSKISNDFMEDKNDSQQTTTPTGTGMGMGM